MINPQLLRHLESVREENEVSTNMSQSNAVKEVIKPPTRHLLSVLEEWIICGGLGCVTMYCIFVPANNDNRLILVASWLSASILVFVLRHTLSAGEEDGIHHTIVGSILDHYRTWSIRRFERQKTEHVVKISHLLGSMAAPMLPTLERESNMDRLHQSQAKNALLALIQLLQIQQDFMERLHEALLILQTCSRFVPGSRPFHALPLTTFRDQVFAVAKSNQNQLATLYSTETAEDEEAETVPSVHRMREMRADTLQLLTDVCCTVVLDPSSRLCGLLQTCIEKSKHLTVYVAGLIDSMKKGPHHPVSSFDHLLLESRDLRLALLLLDEQRPLAPNDASKAALRLSQGITCRLERLFEEDASSTENNEVSSTSRKVDDGVNTVPPGDELVTDEGDSLGGNVAETLLCLTTRSKPKRETLVYSTVVAPKERSRRRKKATDNTVQPPTTLSPFDFIDELQGRLKALPPQTERDASGPEEKEISE